MPLTFGELKSRARALVWPDQTEPEELFSNNEQYIKDALVDIQKHIPYYQGKHRDQFPFCGTFFHCGMTVIQSPNGVVQRVYTLPDGLDCCDVNYEFIVGYDQIKNWLQRHGESWVEPSNNGLPSLQFGYKWSEDTTDKSWGRAGFGKFTIHNQRLYVAPRIESDERIVVEWNGVKHAWSDSDVACDDDDNEFVKCVAAYLKKEHLMWTSNDTTLIQIATSKLMEARAELYWSAQEKSRAVFVESQYPPRLVSIPCLSSQCRTVVDSDFGGVAAAEKEAIIAFVGDIQYDDTPQPSLDVEDLIEGWTPDSFVIGGDLRYTDQTYAEMFAELTYYSSLKSDTPSENRFWPALGNHDLSDGGGIVEWYSQFTLPGNERYYDVVIGACHFFFVNSNTSEPDGTSGISAQAEWLRLKLAASKAKWKVVVMHHPPYSSASALTPGITGMRWPFKQWGADLVLSGHAHLYERLEIDEFPYIVAGTGGATLTTFGAAIAGSQFRYADNWGALRIVCGCDRLVAEFYPIATTTPIDTLTLTKP